VRVSQTNSRISMEIVQNVCYADIYMFSICGSVLAPCIHIYWNSYALWLDLRGKRNLLKQSARCLTLIIKGRKRTCSFDDILVTSTVQMIASRIAVEEYVHSSRNRQLSCYALLIKTWIGRTIAQAVSRWLPTAAARVRTRV
jgi:hypothetical protein